MELGVALLASYKVLRLDRCCERVAPDTPGSSDWWLHKSAETIEAGFCTPEQMARILQPAGLSYDLLDLLKSCVSVTDSCGNYIKIIGCNR